MKKRSFAVLASSMLAGFAMAQAPRKPADPLRGLPYVSAKGWAIADGATGKVLWGFNEDEPRPMASTTKIMTALLVLSLADGNPKILDEIVTYSQVAASTSGSSAKIRADEKLPVRELLYGLLLPSGNDAAVALAEKFGAHFANDGVREPVKAFVAEMNQRCKKLGLKHTEFVDPNGLGRNRTSPRDLCLLTWHAFKFAGFREYVRTPRHQCDLLTPNGDRRTVVWENTNKLLNVEGYDGVKTGTTSAAGSCLIASCRRNSDHLFVVALGAASSESRNADIRNLLRWAWLERGHQK